MQVGISTATFFGKMLTEDSIALIPEMGADVSEVFLTTFSEYEPDFVKLVASRKGNVPVHSVHALTNEFEPQLTNKAERTRLDAERYFVKICEAMRTLGGHYYTFHGASIIKAHHLNVNYPVLGAQMQRLCDIIGEYGGELCQENVHWARYNAPGFFSKIKPYAPSLRACLDIKQAMQSGHDYREYIRDMGTDIRTVHICDYDESGLKPIGEGSFDFEELVRVLDGEGYTGPLIIELYSENYSSFDQVKRSVEYIKNIIHKII